MRASSLLGFWPNKSCLLEFCPCGPSLGHDDDGPGYCLEGFSACLCGLVRVRPLNLAQFSSSTFLSPLSWFRFCNPRFPFFISFYRLSLYLDSRPKLSPTSLISFSIITTRLLQRHLLKDILSSLVKLVTQTIQEG
uniref:Uncharacterized protein n=1 Tax=Salix viminalis TaxID=40686 RepID=A0A6N2M1N0_SALVM